MLAGATRPARASSQKIFPHRFSSLGAACAPKTEKHHI
ncbi:hypothetical protein L580_3533 [Serratia fonticola AU-P3(3)]|nr:hypothetical protein L580_3533 [Serratia fonticola AU-P3(3)]